VVPKLLKIVRPSMSSSRWTFSYPAVRPRPTLSYGADRAVTGQPLDIPALTRLEPDVAPVSGPAVVRASSPALLEKFYDQTITIDPVTRLEGHGKITIQLNGQGEVEDAHFHVTQVRGLSVSRKAGPSTRCQPDGAHLRHLPVSHLLASAKACEAIMSVRIRTRRAIAPHVEYGTVGAVPCVELFYLASPDLLLGMDSDPLSRHVFGCSPPSLSWARRRGVTSLRQHTIELLSGKRIHTGW